MGSKQESLNKRIRQTISDLSDEDLVKMLRAPAQDYTPFARRLAEEEVSRRRQLKSYQKGISRVLDANTGAFRKESTAANKGSGCYIELWSDKNFEGEYLRIEGPIEHDALDLADLSWGSSVSSLRVGASAFVLVYADKDFGGAMLSFGPGQEVADLEELSFDNEIDSVRVVSSIRVFEDLRVADDKKPDREPSGKRRRKK